MGVHYATTPQKDRIVMLYNRLHGGRYGYLSQIAGPLGVKEANLKFAEASALIDELKDQLAQRARGDTRPAGPDAGPAEPAGGGALSAEDALSLLGRTVRLWGADADGEGLDGVAGRVEAIVPGDDLRPQLAVRVTAARTTAAPLAGITVWESE